MTKPNLQTKYENEVIDQFLKENKEGNRMAVPHIEKIVVNAGIGEALSNPNALEKMKEDLSVITGQTPVSKKSKKAISNFKIREGDEVGLMVTLRGRRMWWFLEKFISIVAPRIKDFRGLSKKSFDGKGNYSVGIREHTVFPEVDTSKIDRIRSLQFTIVTNADNNAQGEKLLTLLGLPFTKDTNGN